MVETWDDLLGELIDEAAIMTSPFALINFVTLFCLINTPVARPLLISTLIAKPLTNLQ